MQTLGHLFLSLVIFVPTAFGDVATKEHQLLYEEKGRLIIGLCQRDVELPTREECRPIRSWARVSEVVAFFSASDQARLDPLLQEAQTHLRRVDQIDQKRLMLLSAVTNPPDTTELEEKIDALLKRKQHEDAVWEEFGRQIAAIEAKLADSDSMDLRLQLALAQEGRAKQRALCDAITIEMANEREAFVAAHGGLVDPYVMTQLLEEQKQRLAKYTQVRAKYLGVLAELGAKNRLIAMVNDRSFVYDLVADDPTFASEKKSLTSITALVRKIWDAAASTLSTLNQWEAFVGTVQCAGTEEYRYLGGSRIETAELAMTFELRDVSYPPTASGPQLSLDSVFGTVSWTDDRAAPCAETTFEQKEPKTVVCANNCLLNWVGHDKLSGGAAIASSGPTACNRTIVIGKLRQGLHVFVRSSESPALFEVPFRCTRVF